MKEYYKELEHIKIEILEMFPHVDVSRLSLNGCRAFLEGFSLGVYHDEKEAKKLFEKSRKFIVYNSQKKFKEEHSLLEHQSLKKGSLSPHPTPSKEK